MEICLNSSTPLNPSLLPYLDNIQKVHLNSDGDSILQLLHTIYGEDIPIAIDPLDISDYFGICVEENKRDHINPNTSMLYFCKKHQKFKIVIAPTALEFKKSFLIAYHIGHLFLHLQNNLLYDDMSGEYISKSTIYDHNYQEHRLMNNVYEDTREREAILFAGKLLIPKGALLELLGRLEPHTKYLLSDMCKVFNVSNDLMYKMIKYYKLWDKHKIYDNL